MLLCYGTVPSLQTALVQSTQFLTTHVADDGLVTTSSEYLVNAVADVVAAGRNVYHLPLQSVNATQRDVFAVLSNHDTIYTTLNTSAILRKQSTAESVSATSNTMGFVSALGH